MHKGNNGRGEWGKGMYKTLQTHSAIIYNTDYTALKKRKAETHANKIMKSYIFIAVE